MELKSKGKMYKITLARHPIGISLKNSVAKLLTFKYKIQKLLK